MSCVYARAFIRASLACTHHRRRSYVKRFALPLALQGARKFSRLTSGESGSISHCRGREFCMAGFFILSFQPILFVSPRTIEMLRREAMPCYAPRPYRDTFLFPSRFSILAELCFALLCFVFALRRRRTAEHRGSTAF